MIGDNKMIDLKQGDCLELMKEIPNGSIDMILCDLPYGTTACRWDEVIPFEPLWEQYERIIKDNGAIVLFGSEPFSSNLRMSNLKMFKYDWIWNKKKGGNPLLSKIQPIKIYEVVSVFGKGKVNYYPIMVDRDKPKARGKNKGKTSETTNNAFTKNKVYTQYYPKAIIEFSNANQRNKLHPTQKPVPLFEYLIKTYTNEGDTVLDNCMGSGTTGVACVNTNRNFIGMELDENYFNIAQTRINSIKIKQVAVILSFTIQAMPLALGCLMNNPDLIFSEKISTEQKRFQTCWIYTLYFIRLLPSLHHVVLGQLQKWRLIT